MSDRPLTWKDYCERLGETYDPPRHDPSALRLFLRHPLGYCDLLLHDLADTLGRSGAVRVLGALERIAVVVALVFLVYALRDSEPERHNHAWSTIAQAMDNSANIGLKSALETLHADGASLDHVRLPGGRMRGIRLPGVDLTGAILRRAELSEADLSGAALGDAILFDADLKSANLAGAFLSEAELIGADLTFADLSDAILTGASLSGADLSFADLTRAELDRTRLRGVTLFGTNLSGSDLGDAEGLTLEQLTEACVDGPDSQPYLPAGFERVTLKSCD